MKTRLTISEIIENDTEENKDNMKTPAFECLEMTIKVLNSGGGKGGGGEE